MNRRKFFKRFGQGVAAAVVAPTVLASLPEERSPVEIDIEKLRQYPLTPKDCYSPASYGHFDKSKDMSVNMGFESFRSNLMEDLHKAYGEMKLTELCKILGS